MTDRTIQFAPCVLSDTTDTDAEGRWKDSDRVRWQNGFPEKIGGWQSALLAAGGDVQFRGICRALHDWADLAGQVWIALGTHKALYVFSSGVISDITPIRATAVNVASAFSTDTGGAYDPRPGVNDPHYVRVTHNSHGAQEGDIVNVAQAVAIGGITPIGDYEIRGVIDANNYVIAHQTIPSSTVANGGGAATDLTYYMPAGREAASVGSGVGLGPWGAGTWGTPRSSTSQIAQPRVWSLVSWGEDLLASPLGGTVYVWDRSVGVATRATEVTQAPDQINRILLSSNDRHLIAFGCTDLASSFDPLLVRWCSQGDYTQWTPATSNTSGFKRLDGGSKIITAVHTSFGILIFTDKTLHLMQFIGPPGGFSITQIAGGISIIGPNAVIEQGGVVRWMGNNNFHMFNGAVQVLPCEVQNKVFDDIQLLQGYQVYASLSEDFDEIRWDYPSKESEQNARYVVFNHQEQGWYRGTMQRSAMHEKTSLFSNKPYATDVGGVGVSDDFKSTLFVHELGVDAGDDPMNEYMETFDLMLPAGTEYIHLDKIIPDFKRLEGSVTFTLNAKRAPQQPGGRTKIYPGITRYTEKVSVRMRGKQISWRVSSGDLGVTWRMGHPEFRYEEDGSGR